MARTQTQERTATQQAPRQAPAGNLPTTQDEPKRVHPLVAFRDYANERIETLQSSLPKHISPDVFLSVAMTALQKKPDLLKCTKQSLWNACIMAAQDGLLPDGREGAIAPYGQNADSKRVAEIATWMPMIEGLRKKARNSGEILNWEVHAVRARDHFRFALGDEAFIEHEPYFGQEDPGEILGVYSIATLKEGVKSRDVMTARDVRKIEAKSSAKNGPWKDPTFWGEMAKKTIARRHYKQLPHSAALDRLMARDDAEFDLDHQADEQIEQRQTRRLASTTAAFDRFAGSDQVSDIDPTTGEVIDSDFGRDDPQEGQEQAQTDVAKPKPADVQKPKPEAKKEDPISSGTRVQGSATAKSAADASPAGAAQPADGTTTTSAGAQDQAGSDVTGDHGGDQDDAGDEADLSDPGIDGPRRWPNGAVPSNPDEYEHYAETKIGDFSKPGDVAPWWKSKEEIALRKACQVPQAMFDAILKKAQNRVAELSKK